MTLVVLVSPARWASAGLLRDNGAGRGPVRTASAGPLGCEVLRDGPRSAANVGSTYFVIAPMRSRRLGAVSRGLRQSSAPTG